MTNQVNKAAQHEGETNKGACSRQQGTAKDVARWENIQKQSLCSIRTW